MSSVFAQSAQTGGGSLIGMWSGGGAAAQAAGLDPTDSSVAQVYFSPGGTTIPSPSENSNSLAFAGSGGKDSFVNGTDSG